VRPFGAVSPIGGGELGVEILFAAKSRGPNAIALSYIESAMLNLGGSKFIRQQN